MKVRAEDLCVGNVILTSDNSPITVEGIDSRGSDTHVYITTKTRTGGIFSFKSPLDAEFAVTTLQLWSATYSHEYGIDSYIFLVPNNMEIPTPIDEEKVAKLLGLDFDPNTEVIHAARLVNYSIANPTDIRDDKGKPLPIYVD